MGQGSRWASVIYPQTESKCKRFNMGCCCLPADRVNLAVNSKKETKGRIKMLAPDRVKLTVNSKKETYSRVKMGKESKWAKGQDGLLLFTP